MNDQTNNINASLHSRLATLEQVVSHLTGKLNRAEANAAEAKAALTTGRVTADSFLLPVDPAKSAVETAISILARAGEQFSIVSEEHTNQASACGTKTKRWFLRAK